MIQLYSCLLSFILVVPTSGTTGRLGPFEYESHHAVDKINAIDAEADCVDQGGHLASIHSEEENTFLRGFKTGAIWIGLIQDVLNVTYHWTDGTPTDYFNWDDGLPTSNSECANIWLVIRGKWQQRQCTGEVRGYICQFFSTSYCDIIISGRVGSSDAINGRYIPTYMLNDHAYYVKEKQDPPLFLYWLDVSVLGGCWLVGSVLHSTSGVLAMNCDDVHTPDLITNMWTIWVDDDFWDDANVISLCACTDHGNFGSYLTDNHLRTSSAKECAEACRDKKGGKCKKFSFNQISKYCKHFDNRARSKLQVPWERQDLNVYTERDCFAR